MSAKGRVHPLSAAAPPASILLSEWLFLAALAAAAALLASLRPDKAIDYHVYFQNARHYFGGTGPMYGPSSGTGWAGGVYRYPPIFLDLFRPLAALPLRWGAALWAVGKVACGGAVVIRLRHRWGLASLAAFWPGMLLIAPYFIQELRYGNAQFYIVALVIAAFLASERSAAQGGCWLGLAAALKVWPLFFLPCLLARRRWRFLVSASVAGVGWTLLPALWRGWDAQWSLLRQWLGQERAIALTSAHAGELWYPGQSLHDVMARFLSVVDYTRLSDARYPQVAWLHLATPTVEALWWGAVALLLAGLFYRLARTPGADASGEDAAIALMFCAVVVIEPHVHRLILETLLWPALWLAAQWAQGRLSGARQAWWWLAVGVAVLEPLVPGGARQRAMQAYGMDFWLVVVPLTLLVAFWKCAKRDTA